MIFVSEEDNGGDDIGVIWDPLSIEIRKSEEQADAFDR